MSGPAEKLQGAAHAIGAAIMVLKSEMPVMEAFLKECCDMENFGHVMDPTLYNKSERRAISAVMEPLFAAAVEFVRTHDSHIARAKSAVEKVMNS